MKKVRIELTTGKTINLQCEEILLKWDLKTGKLCELNMEGQVPEVAYLDVTQVIAIVVEREDLK